MTQIVCPSCEQENELAESSAELVTCAHCGVQFPTAALPATGVRECARCFNWERPGEIGWQSQDREGSLAWFCPGCSETLALGNVARHLPPTIPKCPVGPSVTYEGPIPETCGTLPIVFGLVLLCAGPLATLVSGQRVFYGAVLVGTFVLLRGLYGRWTQTPYDQIPFSVWYLTYIPAVIVTALFLYYSLQPR